MDSSADVHNRWNGTAEFKFTYFLHIEMPQIPWMQECYIQINR